MDTFTLDAVPDGDTYCLAAQCLVTRTVIAVNMQLHGEFDSFLRCKATIDDGVPTIHQFNWTDDRGRLPGIFRKLKSADHLEAVFGAGTAGPDATCQDMDRAVYQLVRREVPRPRSDRVLFDSHETAYNEKEPATTGLDWLAPYALTSVTADGALVIHARGRDREEGGVAGKLER